MPLINKKAIDIALGGRVWDLGNKVLYDLCRKHPYHNDTSEVIAKVWLIGRSYAAAIERRKNKSKFRGDDFYIDVVAPNIINSNIDIWFDNLKKVNEINRKTLALILKTHLEITKLFTEISQLQKRSLASKYLHFHFPKLFYIYDSRTLGALYKISKITGRAEKSKYLSDNEYRKLFEKCLSLRKYVYDNHGYKLTPRQIDNLLLYIHEIA